MWPLKIACMCISNRFPHVNVILLACKIFNTQMSAMHVLFINKLWLACIIRQQINIVTPVNATTLCMYVYIAKPKLRDLIHLEVTLDWYPLGLTLGLPQHVLDVIEKDHANDSATCKRKMFSKWLCSIKNCTYSYKSCRSLSCN